MCVEGDARPLSSNGLPRGVKVCPASLGFFAPSNDELGTLRLDSFFTPLRLSAGLFPFKLDALGLASFVAPEKRINVQITCNWLHKPFCKLTI